MQTSHTPEPWNISKDGDAFSVWVGSEHFNPNAEQAGVGHAIGIAKVWREADARLIVHAVNSHADLLEACQMFVRYSTENCQTGKITWEQLESAIHAAITKATGGAK